MAPQLGPLEWAAATVPTPYGDIEVLVEKGKKITLRVPAGTTAEYRQHEYAGPGEFTLA